MTVQLKMRQWSPELAGAATSQIVGETRQYNKLLAKNAGEGKESGKLPTDRGICSTLVA